MKRELAAMFIVRITPGSVFTSLPRSVLMRIVTRALGLRASLTR